MAGGAPIGEFAGVVLKDIHDYSLERFFDRDLLTLSPLLPDSKPVTAIRALVTAIRALHIPTSNDCIKLKPQMHTD